MANIVDYVKKQFNDLDNLPFNPVDSLVLSQFAYIRFDAVFKNKKEDQKLYVKDMLRADLFDKLLKDVWAPKENNELLYAIAANPRFRELEMVHYVNKHDNQTEKQFSAVTYFLPDNIIYIAFRGTDSSIIGWKEDFNMSFAMPVPSQDEALAYLNMIAEKYEGKIMVGGHSKGGNLAIYASMFTSDQIKKRLIAIYSHDGPGFQREVFEGKEYQSIAQLIKKTIPQSSMIGMLLEYQDNHAIVKSKGFWFMQHDPFLWEVNETDFLYQTHLTNGAVYTNKTIHQWLRSSTAAERELFVDTLYEVIKSTNAQTLGDLGDNIIQDGKNILAAIKDVDDKTKSFIVQTLKDLAALSFKNLLPNKKNKGDEDETEDIDDN